MKFNSIKYKLFIILIICFVLGIFLLFEQNNSSYTSILKYTGVFPIPYFRDLSILFCGLKAYTVNQDPYLFPCIDGKPFYNYPSSWKIISHFKIINETNLFKIAFILIIAFYGSFLYIIKPKSWKITAVYIILLISPVCIFALERGNSDIIIFILIALAIGLYNNRLISNLLITIAAILKLFPVGALFAFLLIAKNKIKESMLIVSILLFFGYVLFNLDSIANVSNSTPRPTGPGCFGFFEIPKLAIQYGNLNIYIAYGLLFLITIALLYYSYKYFKLHQSSFHLNKGINQNKFGFIIGSSIYCTSYLIGNNYEYRLIFLLFIVPFIFDNLKRDKIYLFLLLLLVLTFWQSFLGYYIHHLNELLHPFIELTILIILVNMLWSSFIKVKHEIS